MYTLYEIDWMLDQLLGNGRCNTREHEKRWFDSVMRSDGIVAVTLIDSRSKHRALIGFSPSAVVSCHKAVVTLGLHVLECGKERP